jgi:alpha-L-rhamnosidase
MLFAPGPPIVAAPVHLVDQAPVQISTVVPGVVLVDFGRVAYGNLRLTPPATATNRLTIHFGEALTAGRINRKPPGTVRYATTQVTPDRATPIIAAPSADPRNTGQAARRPHVN